MADKYVENADAQSLAEYMQTIPENLRDIYEDTRGILIYQEQIQALAVRMAGYTLGGADLLRRAIGKKEDALLASLKAEFVYGTIQGIPMLEVEIAKLEAVQDNTRDQESINTYKKQLKGMKQSIDDGKPVDGCVGRGYDEQYSIMTFDAIRRFSGYSFNRSHSAAYAMISYWTAHLKTHYPVEFMAAQLTVEAGSEADVQNNVNECRRLGIQILPPDINKSELGYSIEYINKLDDQGAVIGTEKAIRFGLKSIKGIGDGVIEAIMHRPPRENTPETLGEAYRDFDDFFNRIDKRKCNKGYIEKLIESGCFDFDMTNRYQLLNHYYFNLRKDKPFLGKHEEYLKAKKAKKVKASDSFQFNAKDYTEDVISEFEGNYFGFYLTHHPYQDLDYTNWNEVRLGEPVDMGGKITSIKKVKTRKGEDMCFLELDTAGGKIDVTVFPKTLEQFKPEIFKDNIVICRGKKEADYKDPEKTNMLLEQILKPKKKKFQVEKPPELAELAERAKKSKGGKQQMTLDDLGGPVRKADPLSFDSIGDIDNEIQSLQEQNLEQYADGGNSVKEDIRTLESHRKELKEEKKQEDELAELAKLFDF